MSKGKLAGIIIACTIAIIAAIVITGPPSSCTPPSPCPTDAISWHEAKNHIGERTTVYGTVVDTRWASGSNGQPTFLNMGNPYPDQNRFTVVIWIQNRGNFPQPPEDYYDGKTIYVSGLIDSYEGVPQIEVTSPDEICEP